MQLVHIGLISAMPQEIEKFLDYLIDYKSFDYGDLTIYHGFWKPKDKNFEQTKIRISLVWSGWGKVSASRAVTRLISLSENHIPIDLILFTGVAGSANANLKQWDVIIADQVVQYDMDARPLYEKFVIPALNKASMAPNIDYLDLIYSTLVEAKAKGKLKSFGSINKGLIGTGDRFISKKEELIKITKQLEKLQAVEMEGAAVAQVADQEGIAWLVIRVISDTADDSASMDFTGFIKKYEDCCHELISTILANKFISPRKISNLES